MLKSYNRAITDIGFVFAHTGTRGDNHNRVYAIAATILSPSAPPRTFESLVRYPYLTERERYHSNISKEILAAAPEVPVVREQIRAFLKDCPLILTLPYQDNYDDIAKICGEKRFVDLSFAVEFFLPQVDSYSTKRLWEYLHQQERPRIYFTAPQAVDLLTDLMKHICGNELSDVILPRAAALRHFLAKSNTLFGKLFIHLTRNYGQYFDTLFNPCQRPDTDNWKIFFETAAAIPSENVNLTSFHKIDLASLETIFRGIAEGVSDFTFRPSQVEYAKHIASAINDGAVLTIEAGTGTGKTQGYLVPVMEFLYRNSHARIAVSTYTKSLQDQIYKQEIPFITDAIKPYRSIPFSLLKGKSNYICVEKLEGAYDETWQGKELLTWLYFVNLAYHFRDADGDRIGQRVSHYLNKSPFLYQLQREVSARSGCHPKHTRCPAQITTMEARAARLVVTNHHKLAVMNHDATLGRLFKINIIDEANHFEHAVRNTFGEEFNSKDTLGFVEYLESALAKVAGRAVGDLEKNIKEALKAIGDLKSGMHEFSEILGQIKVQPNPGATHNELPATHPVFKERHVGEHLADFRNAIERIEENLKWLENGDMCRMLKIQERTQTRIRGMRADLMQQSITLKNLTEYCAKPNWLAMYDLFVRHWALTAQPVDVSSLIQDNFYRDSISLTYTSATISMDGCFDTFNKIAGMDQPVFIDKEGKVLREFRSAQVASPFSALKAEVVIPEEAVSGIHSKKSLWIDSVVRILPELIRKNRGRTLVLFSSYQDLTAVAKRVENGITEAGFPLLIQRSGYPTGDLCDEFRAVKESVLFGVDTFWYGVDFKGDTLTQVVITRIPYPSITDPLYMARKKTLHPVEYWKRYSYDTYIKMKQGAGRLIRCETDRGKVIILDSRYLLQKEKMPPLLDAEEGALRESDVHDDDVQGVLLGAAHDEQSELFSYLCGLCGCEISEATSVCPSCKRTLKSAGKTSCRILGSEGIKEPRSTETDDYVPPEPQDTISATFEHFMEEECLIDSEAKWYGQSLHRAYRKWLKAKNRNEKQLSRRALWDFLAGHEQITVSSINPRIFSGVRLKNSGFHHQALEDQNMGKQASLSQIRELVLYIGNTGEHSEQLSGYFQHHDYEVRRRACSAANKLRDKEITKYITPCLYAPEPQIRYFALKAVLSSRCFSLVDHVKEIISKEDKEYNLKLCQRILKKFATKITRVHRQTQEIPEQSQLLPDDALVPAPDLKKHTGNRRSFVIGERFNEGCTIEQLARDFNIQKGTVVEHLFRYRRKDRPIRKDGLLMNSSLTEDQRQSVLSSFARLGTKRLRPIYDALNGTIPYDELKLCLLYHLSRDQDRPEDQKTFICLAASRKYGGYCLAGREWNGGKAGPWLRPVSAQENGELSRRDIRLNNGNIPQCMDIITIETEGAAHHPYQKENVLIADKRPWTWQWKLPPAALPDLVDDVKSLWLGGFHSTNGVNDRVPEETMREANEPTIYLIRPNDIALVVNDDLDGRKKVRARFAYRDTHYLLSVTDPVIERTYLMKEPGEYPLNAKDTYLTVSMGEPFNGYCYKLAAAVIMAE